MRQGATGRVRTFDRLGQRFLTGQRALELQASTLIPVHNQPSGDPTPSKAAITVTKDIIRAAQPLGVTVHDQLIIGRGRHISLRDLGLI